jgi:selenocysteine lyase/cysteine desulfurase
VLQITDYACRRLEESGAVIASDRSPAHASGIVSFQLPGRDLKLQRQRLLQSGVVLSHRGGNLRISPHAWNNEEDVERLVQELNCT